MNSDPLDPPAVPWIDRWLPAGADEGPVSFEDWEVVPGEADWTPCNEVLVAERRPYVVSSDAICLARPNHEHPHFALNYDWIETEDPERKLRIVQVRRKILSGIK